MFVGPVFTREALTAPRRVRFHVLPALGVAALLSLLWTVWQVVGGSQPIDGPSISARFGSEAFALLAPLLVLVATVFAALLAAAAVAQEKDRKTLVLLLLTRMSNSELVLGKLLASLLEIVMVVAATAPFFFLLMLFGGISSQQVWRVLAITLASALVAGSIGSTLALWRETTFQALAATTLALLAWLAVGELVASGKLGDQAPPELAAAISPWRAVVDAAQPQLGHSTTVGDSNSGRWNPVVGFLLFAAAAIVAINGLAILLVRVWNPSRAAREGTTEADDAHSIYLAELHAAADDPARTEAVRRSAHVAPGKLRPVWDNPVLWREVRTWAYGKKVVFIRLIYVIAAIACGYATLAAMGQDSTLTLAARVPAVTGPLVPLVVVSLVLACALGVTSLTTERDGKSLDLLLVTDLTPREIVLGKLWGAVFNAKEMILAPLFLAGLLGITGYATGEQVVFLILSIIVLYAFAIMLGIHAGMQYGNSRQAVATSLGTLLFLFIGIAICMRIMLALGKFDNQFGAFAGMLLGGGILLWVGLGAGNPSGAITTVALVTPLATFFAIVSFLQGQYGSASLVTILTYAFATAAMLVPAIAEFDVATGRTSDRAD